MDMLNSIFNRKSVRTYTGEKIADEQLELILKSANASPIGLAKYENVHLTVITNSLLLDEINEKSKKFMHREGVLPLYGAPTFILVSAKMSESSDNVAYSNAAIIVQNMALCATFLDIGACHIWGASAVIQNDEEILKKLNLPDGFTPCCGLIVGVTNEKYEEREININRISRNEIK